MEKSTDKAQNLLVMCLLAIAVGVIGGLGAWFFRVLIGVFHNLLFLGEFNYQYNANIHTPSNPWGAGIILVPVIGAVAVAWLVKTFAPEAKGHGVPEVMDAIYYGGGKIRPVVAVVKSLASAICIGSGGSVGREGPIVQIGSAFGSTLGQFFHIPPRQRITLIAAGAGAGIAATFNAPLGGVLFAIELLLVSVNFRNLLPVALATITASYIGRAMLSVYPAFNFPPLQDVEFQLTSIWSLLLFIPYGLVIGLAAIVFIKGIYWAEDCFDAMPGNYYTRHMLGMLIVGVMLWLMWTFSKPQHYYVQGVGYATIMDIIQGTLTNPAFLLLLIVLKFAATCLTLGSGGSGGVFSPALFLGACMGACFAMVAQIAFPTLEINPVAFALAGMAAMVGATTGAVITGAVMLQEMTADRNVMMPIIITTFVAFGVRKLISPESIYTTKLLRRGHVVPEGLQAAFADARRVSDVMQKSFHVVAEGAAKEAETGVTVVEKDGRVVRVIHPYGPLAKVPADSAGSVGGDSGERPIFISLQPNTPLVDAMREMRLADVSCALVFAHADSNAVKDLVGVLTLRELCDYQTGLAPLM